MAIADWSPTAANNDTTLGVSIAEGCPPSNINNAIRKAMADVATGINFSVLGTFLASTSLSQAQTALGVGSGSTSSNNFAALTNAANKVPYMTGSNAWSTADFTSFGRSVVATGDAAALRTLLGVIGGASASASANSGSVSVPLTASFTLLIQWGTVSLSANSDGTITYSTAYSTAPICVVSGGPAGSGDAGSIHTRGASGTSSQSISNTSGGSLTGSWVAIGKA